MTTTPPPKGTTEPRCEHTEHATRDDGRYGRHFETTDPAGAWEPCPSPPVSAAAPDEREALAAAMHAEVCCPCDPTGCDVSDVPEMRYVDAALAWFATRPAPTVGGKARTPDESCISGAAEHAGAAADDERCGWCGITPTHDPGDCAVAQRAEAQRLCDEDRRYTEAADDEGGQE